MIDPKHLPDSRLKWARGLIRHPQLGNLSKIYCANCGRSGGAVSEEWAKRVTYLCDECSTKWGRLPLPEIPESVVRGG